MKLNILDHIPKEFFNSGPEELHKLLGGPSLIHIKGASDKSLFLTALLHGNETSSFTVLKDILRPYETVVPPKNIIIFIGNTEAAEQGLRHLKHQPDYNRIWEAGELAENQLAMDVIDYARTQNVFASLDIHNNTGKNPNYGCINYLDDRFLKLASHFSQTTVYFTEPHNANSIAFGRLCPAMTIEAGLSGSEEGIQETKELIDYLLNADEIDWCEERKEFDVYHTVARMLVHEEAEINFNFELSQGIDISFIADLDDKNFSLLEVGTVIGKTRDFSLFRVENNQGADITSEFFEFKNELIVTKKKFVPSMLTQLIYVVKEDCLGYVMEFMNPTHKV